MRNYLCLALCLITGLLSAQTVDSVALRRVDSLIQVSRALTDQRNFDKAFEVNALAEKLALEKLGGESTVYSNCCFNRGRINHVRGNYIEADSLLHEAKAIREKVLGKEHPLYAESLFGIAMLTFDMGNYEKAVTLALEAKAIREKALGKDHPLFAASLNGLALLYFNMGNYEKAEPLYLEAKAIREKVLGKNHPLYTRSLNALATVYLYLGNYEKAEPLFLEAKATREKTLGKDHPHYTESLSGLAQLYADMGNYEKAEILFLETKAIREKILGKDHPDYGTSLSSLATLYTNMGNSEKAELLYLEAKAIWEKTLGKEEPDYAANVSNFANLYLVTGNYEKAEPLYLEAKAIWEKTLRTAHPNYATTLNNLAIVYLNMGNYEKAEPLYLESETVREKILGKEHPDYSRSLGGLAILHMSMGNYEKAEPLYVKYALTNQSILKKAIHHLSERELSSYLNQFSESHDMTISFVQLSARKNAVPICYDNSLFYKGFLLQAAGQIKRMSLSNSAAAENFNLLKSYERRLAAQYAQPIADRDSTSVSDLEAKVNDLEKDLARTVAGFGQALRQVKWQEVQTALKPNEAAIEFVSYRFYQKKETDSTLYAALILLPGTDAPKFIPLFEEKQLTALLKTEGSPQATFYNELYAAAKKGEQLYDLIWKPISTALPQGATAYCSPSGLLHRLNLGASPPPTAEHWLKTTA